MNVKDPEDFGRTQFEAWIPQGEIGNVNDIGSTVAFLSSDYAKYINGTEIYVDGSYMNSTIQYDPRPPRKSAAVWQIK